MIKKFQNDPQRRIPWYESIPFVKLSIRATPNSVTKLSPFEVLHGDKMRLPTSVIV